MIDSPSRDKVKNALKLVLTLDKNVNILEKNIYDASKNDELTYLSIAYQLVTDIKGGKKLKELLDEIKQNKVFWKHTSLNDFIEEEIEQDNFIIQPFEIVEGITQCKCGSKRVYSYTKQTRGGDESSTTFNECLKCKSKWSYSG